MKDRPGEVDVLVGVNPVLEQLRTMPAAVRRIFVASTAHGGARKVIEAANAARVPVVVEEPRRLARRAAGHVHQGVVAEIEPFRYLGWYDLLELRPDCVAALDQVTDPRNLGAILRVADAAGVGALIVLEHRAAGITPVAAR